MNIKSGKGYQIAAVVCRILLGAVFLFSGLVKSIDPWGTALKIGEYFSAFGVGALSWSAAPLAVVQCALELSLGLMLLFRVRMKLSSFVTLLFMAFFTVLTLIIAIWNPVDDCGCFGDALKISNWMTFAKNVVLLPVSVVVWHSSRSEKALPFPRRDIWLTAVFAAAALGLNVYSWYNLPPVDTFEFKRGTDLRSDVLCSACMERSVVVLCEDTATGERREFAVTDTVWYDTARWRYVDTRTPYDNLPEKLQQYDFALSVAGGDIAGDVVYKNGVTYMLMVRDMEKWSDQCRHEMDKFLEGLSEERLADVIFVEGYDAQSASAGVNTVIGGRTLPAAAMDRKLMARMLRADAGVVIVKDGVIVDKHSCRNMEKVLKGMW